MDDPQAPLHAVLLRPIGRVDEDVVALGLGAQEVLGERRAMVGPLPLPGRLHDPARGALLPQDLRRYRLPLIY